MAQSDLLKVVRSTSLTDLRSMIVAREKLDKLLDRKSALHKDLSSVEQEIEAVERSLGQPAPKTPTARKAPPGRKKKRAAARGRKTAHLSIPSLIVETLREKNRPVSIAELADTLLNEKKYKTTSGNFKHQLRVILYANRKGWFKKLGSGTFALADAGVSAHDRPAPETKTAAAGKKATPKKATPKKATPKQATPVKPTTAKKAPAKAKAAPTGKKKTAQPPIKPLVVDVLAKKKRAMTIQEISDAILHERKFQTDAKNFRGNVALVLYGDKKGLFRKLEAGKFALA